MRTSQRTGVSIFASRTTCPALVGSLSTDQSFQKSLQLSHADKIELKKISFPYENKKCATAQTIPKRTKKLSIDNGLQWWTDRRPTCNMRFASGGVKCLNSSAVFKSNFSVGLTVLCPEIPLDRKAVKRYVQILETHTRNF